MVCSYPLFDILLQSPRNPDHLFDFAMGDSAANVVISEDRFALVLDANGTMLRVTSVQNFKPQQFTILGWDVANIDETVSDLNQRGILFEKYGMAGQDERGIWKSPSGARVAWFKDPDGNVLSLTQFP